MRTLLNLLRDQDQGFLRIIAELWGFDFPQGTLREIASHLSSQMLEPETLTEIVTALPTSTNEALIDLVRQGGRTPWHAWERKYGQVRVMGPGRRDREQPWRATSSPSEGLWYRGLLGRAFVDSPRGPEEFAYLPTEVFQQLERHPEADPAPQIEPIQPPQTHIEAAATIIDDCTTILAALRRLPTPLAGKIAAILPQLTSQMIQPESLQLCLALVTEIGLIRKGSLEADLDAVPEFLLADRMQSLQNLYSTWKDSTAWNDLSALPGLQSGRGEWPNDPVLPRATIIRWLHRLKVGDWYSITDVVRAIYQEDPAFQRPAGQFDTWYIHDTEGVPLDGIEHWYAVEGALLRSLIVGPLRWFGALQLGYDENSGMISGFTPTKLFGLLEDPDRILPPVEEQGTAIIRGDGSVTIPRLAPRSLRYQLARLLEWEGLEGSVYHYRLSIRAIKRAKQQGLEANQVRAILMQASGSELPPTVQKAMQQYEDRGHAARIDPHYLLRVSEPGQLDDLLNHKVTQRYLVERLSDTTAIVQKGQWEKLVRAAVEVGFLIDGPEGISNLNERE